MSKVNWKRYKTFNVIYPLGGTIAFFFLAVKYSYLLFNSGSGARSIFIAFLLMLFLGGIGYIWFKITMANRKEPDQD